MKKIIILILVLSTILFGCKSKAISTIYSDKIMYKDSIDNKYKILKISILDDNVYVIIAQKRDSVYKIVSEKEKYPSISCRVIKEYQTETLNLVQIFPHSRIQGYELSGSYYTAVKGINVNGTIIGIDSISNNTLYRADNLKGLCITRE